MSRKLCGKKIHLGWPNGRIFHLPLDFPESYGVPFPSLFNIRYLLGEIGRVRSRPNLTRTIQKDPKKNGVWVNYGMIFGAPPNIDCHGNPQPSFLEVISHILGFKNLHFWWFWGPRVALILWLWSTNTLGGSSKSLPMMPPGILG